MLFPVNVQLLMVALILRTYMTPKSPLPDGRDPFRITGSLMVVSALLRLKRCCHRGEGDCQGDACVSCRMCECLHHGREQGERHGSNFRRYGVGHSSSRPRIQFNTGIFDLVCVSPFFKKEVHDHISPCQLEHAPQLLRMVVRSAPSTVPSPSRSAVQSSPVQPH